MQSALIAASYSPYLFGIYQRVATPRGPDKAIIALVPSFLGVTYHALTNNGVFHDFPSFILNSA